MPIYLFVEVLFASYLFILGFENFLYLWNTGDYGMYRVCKVRCVFSAVAVVVLSLLLLFGGVIAITKAR